VKTQLFDTTRIQGVRLKFADGTIGTFYGPTVLEVEDIKKAEITEVTVFAPQKIAGHSRWNPIATVEEGGHGRQ